MGLGENRLGTEDSSDTKKSPISAVRHEITRARQWNTPGVEPDLVGGRRYLKTGCGETMMTT